MIAIAVILLAFLVIAELLRACWLVGRVLVCALGIAVLLLLTPFAWLFSPRRRAW